MKPTIEQAINNQIKEELYSGYLYWAMSAHCEHLNLPGFATWFFVQAQEEFDHTRGFYNFMHERGGKVILQALEQPPHEFEGPLQMFEAALSHEQHITGKINELYELARQEKDYAFESFLKWYIDEQVEEEDTAQAIVDKIKMVGTSAPNLYLLDKEMSSRTYSPSSILKQD